MLAYILFWIATLAWASAFKSKPSQLFFLFGVFVFVGLRYETGFDWPVYKSGFEILQNDFSFESARWYSELFQIELGYVLLVAISGQIFPEYEYFQALISLVFFASIVSLCKAFNVKNAALAIALAGTFLLLTLMMSTVRQCLAVAIFNFAVSAAMSKRRTAMVALSVLAVTVHVSTLFYIFALIFAALKPSQTPAPRTVVLMVAGGNAAALSLTLVVGFLPEFIANRVDFYRLDQAIQAISLWQLYFIGLIVSIIIFTLFGMKQLRNPDPRTFFLRRLIIAIAVMCLCTLPLNVIRDRISYEMFLLFAVFLGHREVQFALLARGATASVGLFFSIFNILSPTNRLVFLPYQNAIGVAVTGDEGDGQLRQNQFQGDFDRSYQQ